MWLALVHVAILSIRALYLLCMMASSVLTAFMPYWMSALMMAVLPMRSSLTLSTSASASVMA